MKQLLIVLFCYTVCCSNVNSQNCNTQPFTGEELNNQPWYMNQNYIDSLIKVNRNYYISQKNESNLRVSCDSEQSSLYIPINFTVFYNNVTNEIPANRFREAIEETNEIYRNNDIDVTFYLNCMNHEFNSPIGATLGAVDLPFLPRTSLCDIDRNSVNIMIGRDGAAGGFSLFVPAENVIILDVAINGNTLAHELGHYFGLLNHTHFGFGPGNLAGLIGIGREKCFLESVRRNQNYSYADAILCTGNTPTWLNIFNTVPPIKVGRICERAVDGFCDTNADPMIANAVIQMGDVCFYDNGLTTDPWETLYNPTVNDFQIEADEPHARNLMSYTIPDCRGDLSTSQRAVIIQNMIDQGYASGGEIQADSFEPDDTPAAGLLNILQIGVVQNRTIHDNLCTRFGQFGLPLPIPGCPDQNNNVDILRIQNNAFGTLQIVVNECETPNLINTVNVFEADASGSFVLPIPLNLVSSTSNQKIFEIALPCASLPSDMLVEVLANPDITGHYSIELNDTSPINLISPNSNILCIGQSFSLVNAPLGATITWATTGGINITSTPTTALVTDVIPDDDPLTVSVTINLGGCELVLSKTFLGISDLGTGFQIIQVHPVCYDEGSDNSIPGLFRIDPTPTSNVQWQILNGEILNNNTSSFVNVSSSDRSDISLQVTISDDCGNSLSEINTFSVSECFNFCVDSEDIEVIITSCTVAFDFDLTSDAIPEYSYIITDKEETRIFDHEEFQNSNNFDIDIREYPTDEYRIHIYCENDGYSSKDFEVIKPAACSPTIQIKNCWLGYKLNNCNNVHAKWLTPTGEILVQDKIEIIVDGIYTLQVFNDLDCSYSEETYEVIGCEVELDSQLCGDINSSASGNGNYSESFVSPGNGILHFDFDAHYVPDILEISLNNQLEITSGVFSTDHCSTSYPNCGYTINPGCSRTFYALLPVQKGDVIEIDVVANPCQDLSTVWDLVTSCSTEPYYFGGTNKVRTEFLENIQQESITVFPNPVTATINIFISSKNYEKLGYSIFNIQGELISSEEIPTNEDYIRNVEMLPSGIYFVKLVGSKDVEFAKPVKFVKMN